jgi:uncharacterized protein (DUF1015 family)
LSEWAKNAIVPAKRRHSIREAAVTEVIGLVGLRPSPEHIEKVVTPPYDVIKKGTPLEKQLAENPASFFHVILGSDPLASLKRLRAEGFLLEDNEPAFYVYEQRWGEGGEASVRTGVFGAAAVTPYEEHQVIRHEKTFDDKVQGRIALTRKIEHTVGPVFMLTKAPIAPVLEAAKKGEPICEFSSVFSGGNDLNGIACRVWRVVQDSDEGRAIGETLGKEPLYIADGHHRYHAALKNEQSHLLVYVTDEAKILAYNRVVNGKVPFEDIREKLDLSQADAFATPAKNAFRLYAKSGTYTLKAKEVPTDVVGRLDCAILERELYPHLGLTHDLIVDPDHFDYYSEGALDQMQAVVDEGKYELAIALHPVSIDELMAVADAGLKDPDVVMPEKSTFFSPKIHSGIFLYRHQPKGQ